jgi:hypothetical protein
MDYSNTSNERIKKIFGSRAAGKTDQELDTIKKDPTKMGEMMYGKDTKMGQQMGNTEAGDGWKYRGRGFIQLTGKSNYAAASKAIYGDNRLVDNPDLVNDPAVAAEVSAWYMKKGQARMASGLGIDTKNMTQDQANLLATSQIAGGDIRKKGAIGQELSGKVDKFASSGQIQAIAGAPGGPATATATPTGVDAGGRGPGMKDDPRLAKPATTTPTTATTPAAGEVQTPQFAMQILIKDGIIPTTIAFQDLVKKGIMPMLTGVVAAEKRGPDRILAGAETPKTEIIAQKEKEAQEKIELERQQAANREQLRKEEIMAMNGPAGQNSPGGEATDLNTALRELIAINKRTADLNEKQLSVQSGLSGDLFA